jgi:hypothetical protein
VQRSTAQRLGDVAIVLIAVAALSLVSNVWTGADRTDGHASMFWSWVGLSLNQTLFPTFAASCVYSWMDDARRRPVRWSVLAIFALSALAAVGEAVFGGNLIGGGERTARYLQDATSLLVVAGGFTLIMGLLPGVAVDPDGAE